MANAKTSLSIAVLTADQLYQRTREERSNRDLFAERLVDGVKVKRLHYLCIGEYDKQVHVVLSLGQRIVGIAGLQVNPHDTDMYWVQHVSVETKHRGKGYARLLIEALYAHAIEQGKVVSPSSFSQLGQRLKPIFTRLDQQYPQAASGQAHRDFF